MRWKHDLGRFNIGSRITVYWHYYRWLWIWGNYHQMYQLDLGPISIAFWKEVEPIEEPKEETLPQTQQWKEDNDRRNHEADWP